MSVEGDELCPHDKLGVCAKCLRDAEIARAARRHPAALRPNEKYWERPEEHSREAAPPASPEQASSVPQQPRIGPGTQISVQLANGCWLDGVISVVDRASGQILFLWMPLQLDLASFRRLPLRLTPKTLASQSVTTFKRVPKLPPPRGCWFLCPDGVAILTCPTCDRQCPAPSTVHSIADDGMVSPSIVCECGWHGFARLGGYGDEKVML